MVKLAALGHYYTAHAETSAGRKAFASADFLFALQSPQFAKPAFASTTHPECTITPASDTHLDVEPFAEELCALSAMATAHRNKPD